ncbi:MAG: tRNA preQ1(34) S-adenosylmethionine ribosyltransferase-isomerase QueA, partial [Tepidiformaceae bacterium]
REEGVVLLEFERPFDPATVGSVPLPPYIKEYHGDAERYQTVYSRDPRSAAAPTAGLHFTRELFERLSDRGVERAAVTLDVGPGTFKPVTVDDPHDHNLHSEHVSLPQPTAEAITRAKAEHRRIVAVGTTVVRTLEHVARERGAVEPYEGWTGLRILPGDSFSVVDVLITNFHLPRSTLLMLVSALAGTDFVLAAYREAVAQRYRFYSFGDAMLVLP